MKQETKINPKLVYDESAIRSSLKYEVFVDLQKAAELLRFLGLSDDIISESRILITNKINPTHAGTYIHSQKTIKLKAGAGYEAYQDLRLNGFKGNLHLVSQKTAFSAANKAFNNTFLHEAYHMYDYHFNLDPAEESAKLKRQNSIGCLSMLASTLLASSSVKMLENIGLATNIACIDTPAIIASGLIGLVAASQYTHKKYYRNDPSEIAARGFAKKYNEDIRWRNIVSFSLKELK